MHTRQLNILLILVQVLTLLWVMPAQAMGTINASALDSPVIPKMVTLRIINQIQSPIQVTLTGPTRYVLTAKPGQSDHVVIAGNYRYSYAACGFAINKRINLSNSNRLVTRTCKFGSLVMDNQTGGTMFLDLVGPDGFKRKHILPEGETVLSLPTQMFDYTAVAMCGKDSGRINVSRGKTTIHWYCSDKIKKTK